MFVITIPHPDKGVDAIILKTGVRNYARIVVLIGIENGVKVDVTEERTPRVVKFKNL